MNQPSSDSYPTRSTPHLVAGLLLAGTLLQIWIYFRGVPYHYDEVRLILNVFERGYAELFGPLANDQGSPVGYLWSLKLGYSLLGAGETGLRLSSLLASLVFPFLVWSVAKSVLNRWGCLWAAAYCSLAPPLVFRATEAKQYSFDLLFAALLLRLGLPLLRVAPWNRNGFLTFAGVGVLAAFCSHSALFMLAGFGLLFALRTLTEKKWLDLAIVCASGTIWLATFITLFVLSMGDFVETDALKQYWARDFLPLPLGLSSARWLLHVFGQIVYMPTQEPLLTGISGLLLLFSFFTAGPRLGRWVMAALLLPGLLNLLAACLHVYPIGDRMIYYLAPLIAILTGAGVDELATRFTNKRPSFRVPTVAPAACCLAYIVFSLLTAPRYELSTGGRFQTPRLLVQLGPRMREQPHPVFVDSDAEFPYKFYANHIEGSPQAFTFVRFPNRENGELERMQDYTDTFDEMWFVIPRMVWAGRGKVGFPQIPTRQFMNRHGFHIQEILLTPDISAFRYAKRPSPANIDLSAYVEPK